MSRHQVHRFAEAQRRRTAGCDGTASGSSRWTPHGVPRDTRSRHRIRLRLVDGRISERWVIRDDLTMILQLGAHPIAPGLGRSLGGTARRPNCSCAPAGGGRPIDGVQAMVAGSRGVSGGGRVLPDAIETERLSLHVLTVDEAQAIVSGRPRLPSWHDEFPGDDDVDAASMVVDAGSASGWGPRQIVTVGGGLVVGTIGFIGPPEIVAGVSEVEVGYGLVPSARNAGLATEALIAMLGAARRLSVRVRATVGPDNTASRRVLDKCGFTLAGITDDGQLVVRSVPTP